MKIAIHNRKGGVGKSLLSLNLAGCFACRGKRVMLIDKDPQASSLMFSRLADRNGRMMPFVVSNSYTTGFDTYIFDYGPGVIDDYQADLVVVPTLLDAQSFLIFNSTKKALQSFGKTILPVAQRYRPDRAEQRQLSADFECVVRDRAIYANTYGQGQTVFDSVAPYSQKARDEISFIAEKITTTIQGEPL